MAEAYDWSGFYGALCEHGPQLLLGIDEDDGVREVIAMTAADDRTTSGRMVSATRWQRAPPPVTCEPACWAPSRCGGRTC